MEENERVERRRWVCDGCKSEKEESCLGRKKKELHWSENVK